MASSFTQIPINRPLYTGSLTLSTSPKNLLALIRAIASPAGFYTNVPGATRAYSLQADPANSNGDNILVGDENLTLSPQNCGVNMVPGSSLNREATTPAMGPLGAIYVAASTGSPILNFAVYPE